MVWVLLAPLVALIGTVVFSRRPDLREGTAFLSGGLTLAAVLSLYLRFEELKGQTWVLWELFPGIPLAFRLDGLGMLFL
ncbi:MAG: monovalent cation/H+ antiporter subunit D family protein, partial [Candidatus Eremiobacteraeota bacterium]|nr:monovalent cation/H+ antiporter subunit D family protein [Candidatus Eremiobacteraeota bacterium]